MPPLTSGYIQNNERLTPMSYRTKSVYTQTKVDGPGALKCDNLDFDCEVWNGSEPKHCPKAQDSNKVGATWYDYGYCDPKPAPSHKVFLPKPPHPVMPHIKPTTTTSSHSSTTKSKTITPKETKTKTPKVKTPTQAKSTATSALTKPVVHVDNDPKDVSLTSLLRFINL